MVHRVVRHVEVWSVVKVAIAFAACSYVIGMISGYLLWRAADRVGTIGGIEGFMEDSGGYDSFEIVGDVVFTTAVGAFAVLAVLFVAMAAVGALLFNLISDLTGGIRMTAIDEDLIVTPARRPPADRQARPEAPSPESTRRSSAEDAPTGTTDATSAAAPGPAAPVADTTPAYDPWKTPAPNEPWTPAEPATAGPTSTGAASANGHSSSSPVGSTDSAETADDASEAEPTGPR